MEHPRPGTEGPEAEMRPTDQGRGYSRVPPEFHGSVKSREKGGRGTKWEKKDRKRREEESSGRLEPMKATKTD